MTATLKLFSDRTGVAILGLCTLVSIANSMLFTVSAGLPISPITRGGLVGNMVAVIAAWVILRRGSRGGFIQQIVAGALAALIHYFLVVNIWSVAYYGL